MGEENAIPVRRARGLPDPLVVALRGGSESALARLAEECAEHLLPQLRSRLGRRSRLGLEAEDVLQDAFLRAIARLPDFQGETRREFQTWLYRIAINRLIDAFRAARRERERDGRVVCTDLAALEEWGIGRAASLRPGGAAARAGRPLTAVPSGAHAVQETPDGVADGERERFLDGARCVGEAERGQREALVLRDLQTLSWESLGFLAGRTPEGTKSLYYRARRAARAQTRLEFRS